MYREFLMKQALKTAQQSFLRRSDRVAAFDPERWLPHKFSFVANRVSATLAHMYAERFGMSVIGWRVVAVLGRHAPLSGKELAERLGIDQVSVTRALAQLMSLRLVSRRTDPADRRKAALRLTTTGRAAYEEVVPLALAIESALIKKLSGQEIELLQRTMTKLVERAGVILADDRSWRSFFRR